MTSRSDPAFCQAVNCSEPLDAAWKIMCGRHWHLVPEHLRIAINRRGATADERRAAINSAVFTVERAELGRRLL